MIRKVFDGLTRLSQKRGLLWGLFALAIVTRLIGTYIGGTRSEDEDNWHLEIAQNFLAGNGLRLETVWGPTYSWIQPGLAAIHIVFIPLFRDHYVLAERIFLLLFSSITILLFFRLCLEVFPRPVALFGTLALILYPPQWFWMTRLNPHSFGTNLLVINFLLYFLFIRNPRTWLVFLIGFIWGAMTLFRPEYLPGIAGLAIGCFMARNTWKNKFTHVAAMAAGCILFLSPWVIRNYKIHNGLVVSTTHYAINIWMVFSPEYNFDSASIPYTEEMDRELKNEPNEVKRAAIWMREAKKNIRENPGMAVRHLFGNFLTYWRPWLSPKVASWKENGAYIVSYLPLFLLFVAGLFQLPWRDPRWMGVVLFLFIKMMAHLPFYMIVRFREATMPLMLLIALVPIWRIWLKTQAAPRR